MCDSARVDGPMCDVAHRSGHHRMIAANGRHRAGNRRRLRCNAASGGRSCQRRTRCGDLFKTVGRFIRDAVVRSRTLGRLAARCSDRSAGNRLSHCRRDRSPRISGSRCPPFLTVLCGIPGTDRCGGEFCVAFGTATHSADVRQPGGQCSAPSPARCCPATAGQR